MSTVQVIAPSNLEAGYSFTAQVDGKDFQVTVPEGGVTEGQILEVPYPKFDDAKKSDGLDDVPTGRWRNDLCSCCDIFCNGLFWMAACCDILLVGQLLNRLGLDSIGSSGGDKKTVWMITWVIFVLFILVGYWVWPLFIIWVVLCMTKIRNLLRRKYQIPASSCGDSMDDCCMSFWCTCCVLVQMARHTHDTDKYPYNCCAETGLPATAPMVDVSKV